jgi:hypothetical protein
VLLCREGQHVEHSYRRRDTNPLFVDPRLLHLIRVTVDERGKEFVETVCRQMQIRLNVARADRYSADV